MKQSIELNVNGTVQRLDVEHRQTLLDALRDQLGLTGTRRGCDTSYCGCCTVLLDGKAVHSCSVLAVAAQGKSVVTVEGLAEDGRLHPLQQAFVDHGAIQCGFCTPGMILSAKALLDQNPHPTEEEVRIGLSGNLCRCTGYVKVVQAVLAVAGPAKGEREVGRTPVGNYTVIGKSVPRVDAVAKATAQASYLDDVTLPGMLVGKLLYSTHHHARIRHIDTTKARALPGVVAVATAADCPDVLTGSILKDLPAFARHKVRYAGEPMAAVAAVDEDTAEKALELIEVEYEELPAVFDPEEAMKPEAPVIHEDIERYAGYVPGGPRSGYGKNIADCTHAHRGDMDKGFKEADFILEDTFLTCRQYACPMETRRVIAQADPFSGQVRVWSSSQISGGLRSAIAELLRLPAGKVSVRWNYVGGGFGSKTAPYLEPVAAILAGKARRPVKMVLSRKEDFMVGPRAPAIVHMRTGVKNDGRIVAREVRTVLDAGAYAVLGGQLSRVVAEVTGAVYKVPNVSASAYAVYTNHPRGGAVRGFGQPEMFLACESQMDMIAERLGIDPLELRLRNAVTEGDTTNAGRPLRNVSLRECLQAVADRVDWKGKRTARVPGRGLGIGCSMAMSGLLSTGALVKIDDDGSVAVITDVVDIGQGTHTSLAQIAAEEMGVPLAAVRIVSGDTDFAPFDVGVFADRGTGLGGAAVRAACREAKEELLGAASELLEAGPADLEVRDGMVSVRGAPGRAIPFGAVAGYAHYARGKFPMGRGVGSSSRTADPKAIEGGVRIPSQSQTFAAAAAEVEVDRETGVVKVLGITLAADCGLAINPVAVEGQTEQSACFATAQTLDEEILFDQDRAVNVELSDYLVPTAVEAPKITAVLVEVPEEDGPFGAKGFSDVQPGAVMAALANAIYDAVGVRIKELPITPERVLAAMKQEGK